MGRLLERSEYDPYGKFTIDDSMNAVIASSLIENRFSFTGQEYDSATGSYRFLYRNYNPETGVFNQRDLIEYEDGMGMYQYVGNNPANGVDILGLKRVETDPCYHDSKKVKYITGWEVEREKKRLWEYNQETYGSNNFEGIGTADSRFYKGLLNSQHGNNRYFFEGQELANYELNYYFTGYIAGKRGFGGGFSQATSRAWLGLKSTKGLASGVTSLDWQATKDGYNKLDWPAIKDAINPGGDRPNLMHKGNFDGRYENMGEADYEVPLFEKALDLLNAPNTWYRSDDAASNMGVNIDNEVTYFGEWWPVINPETGELGYEFFSNLEIPDNRWEEYLAYIRENCKKKKGSQKPGKPQNIKTEFISLMWSSDPNEIIGPKGIEEPQWVSINDRMPYTIYCENDETATAPARFIRITTPVQPNQDPVTLELGSFGFNNQEFEIPAGNSSYYTRLDCRDSLGIYVDIIAGYDVTKNEIFWEFKTIDPVTLLPSEDPAKGVLLLRDSVETKYGHGFVNFSIKPVTTAQTLDMIEADAEIVFDDNEVIPTNVHANTIDAVSPTSAITNAIVNNNTVTLSWNGSDDAAGVGMDHYSLYVSLDGANYAIFAPEVTSTDTTFLLAESGQYCFFVLATDKVGNTEQMRQDVIQCVNIQSIALPVTGLYLTAVNQKTDNILSWSTATETDTKTFIIERSFDGVNFESISMVEANGFSTSESKYNYIDKNVDKLNSNTFFYRLKEVDIDGQYTYSDIILIRYLASNVAFRSIVYPNPTRNTVNVLIGSMDLIGTQAQLFDVNGKILSRITISKKTEQIDITGYTQGIYLLKLKNGEILRIIKQ